MRATSFRILTATALCLGLLIPAGTATAAVTAKDPKGFTRAIPDPIPPIPGQNGTPAPAQAPPKASAPAMTRHWPTAGTATLSPSSRKAVVGSDAITATLTASTPAAPATSAGSDASSTSTTNSTTTVDAATGSSTSTQPTPGRDHSPAPSGSDAPTQEASSTSATAPAAKATPDAAPEPSLRVEVLDEKASTAKGSTAPALKVDCPTCTPGQPQTVSVALSRDMLDSLAGADPAAHLAWKVTDSATGTTTVPTVTTSADTTTLILADVSSSSTLLLTAAASPTATDGTGTFAATSLKEASTWGVSTQSGAFTWSYPMPVTNPAAGPAPQLGLSYNSQSVDGQSGTTNNQPSVVGDGWNLAGTGFIERSYLSCVQDGNTSSGDLCWGPENATLSFGGHSGVMVKAADGTWHTQTDDGSRIELIGNTSGAYAGEYWRLTTRDGTQYFFGRHTLPGWASGQPVTNSTWTVPVAGNNSGERCATGTFATSFCTQAWRWNLDYIVDTHGNSQALYYTPETNQYQQNGTTTATYTRGGYLTRIDYGMRAGTELTTPAPYQVAFTMGDRCIPGQVCDSAHPTSWPDVPWYLSCPGAAGCATNTTPTFFTLKRLATVTAKVTSGGVTTTTDTWTLTHSFPAPGDGTSAALVLDQVQHAATATTPTVTLPPTIFRYTSLANRVWAVDGLAPLMRYRLATVDTELGASIVATYSGVDCTPAEIPTLTANVASNTRRCFPQWWSPSNSTPTKLDFFHVYVVTATTATPKTSGTAGTAVQTFYDYTGTPAYRYPANPFVAPAYRTWSTYAGYSKVRVSVGDSGSPATRQATEYTYLQGLDGDRATPTGGTKSVTRSAGDPGAAIAVTDSLWWAGHVLEEKHTNGIAGAMLTDTTTTPYASAPTATDTYRSARYTGTDTTTTLTALAAGGNRVTKTTTGHDTLGRVTALDDLADTTTAADDRCTRTTYLDNTSAWLLQYPGTIETVGKTCTTTPTYPADAISTARTSYDGQAAGASPTKGDATRAEVVKAYTGSTPVWLTTSSTTYDALGRPVTTSDTRTGTTRSTTTTYTPTTGPVTTVAVTNDQRGWTSTTTVDPTRGLPVKSVDLNGNTTETTYDALGRVTNVWLPTQPRATNPTAPSAAYTYAVSTTVPNVTTSAILNASGSTVTSYTLTDGLGRTIQTQTPTFGGGRRIADTFYDTAGRTKLLSPAYYSVADASGTLFVPSTTIPQQIRTDYDTLGRTVATVLLADNVERYRTTTGYGGNDTTTTPPTGAPPTRTVFDARGNTTALTQYTGTTPTGPGTTTTYTYNPRGQRTAMTDTAGNTWTWTFDTLGRQTAATDPDTGTTTTSYDDANRAIAITSASGTPDATTIATTYDDLDRPTATYLGTTSGTQLTARTYDTATGGKGQPATATRYTAGAAGPAYVTATTAYNTLTQPLNSVVTIPAGNGPLTGTWTTSSVYAVDGKLARYVLPAGGGLTAETVRLGYGSLGELGGLSSTQGSYVGVASYDALGRLTQTEGAQGSADIIRTSYYDNATWRVTRQLTQRVAATGAVIADRAYTYTNSGQITQITDTTPTVGTDTQCFRYDYQQQLTEAFTPNTNTCAALPTGPSSLGGPAPFWTSYSYTTTGNRTSTIKHPTTTGAPTLTDSIAYPAPGAGVTRPHALTGVTHSSSATTSTTTDLTSYDNAGRATTSGGKTATYTPEGRLAKIVSGGTTVQTDIYDADNTRLLHTDATGTTLTLGTMELKVAAGASTATATRTYLFAGNPVAERTTATGTNTLRYLDTNHQGTVTATIDTTNTPTRRYYDPYGNPRDPTPITWATNHGYLNAPTDPTTTHLGVREYVTTTGQFTTPDPILEPLTPAQHHPYNYAHNNPTNQTDPNGLRPLGADDTGCTNCKHTGNESTGTASWSFGNEPYIASVGTQVVKATSKSAFTAAVQKAKTTRVDSEFRPNRSERFKALSSGANCNMSIGPTGGCDVPQIMEGEALLESLCDQRGIQCGRDAGEVLLDIIAAGAVSVGLGSGRLGDNAGASAGSAMVKYDADVALGQITRGGRATASQLDEFGRTQGWMRSQTATGPVKYTDSNGVVRLTIKQGGPRAPGSDGPHVEIRNVEGLRVDPYGNPVTRKSVGNHTPIEWDR